MKDKLFKCFSFGLFRYLVNDGFIPVSQRNNLKDSSQNVWLFVNNDRLKESLKKYKK